jgi:hypothetical protein
MTPDEHVNEATRLLGEAEAWGVGDGFDATRVMAAQCHVQMAMYQQATTLVEQGTALVEHAIEPPPYTVAITKAQAAQ